MSHAFVSLLLESAGISIGVDESGDEECATEVQDEFRAMTTR